MNKIQNHVKEQKVVLIKRWWKTKSTKQKISKKTCYKENNEQNTRDKTQKPKKPKTKKPLIIINYLSSWHGAPSLAWEF